MESARITGSGGLPNCTARSDSQSALGNPAGLAPRRGTDIISTYEEGFSSMQRECSVAATRNNLGIEASFSTVPTIDKYNGTGQKQGQFDFNDFGLKLSAGFRAMRDLSLGMGIKGFTKTMDRERTYGGYLNAGMIWNVGGGLSFGAMCDNIGKETSFNDSDGIRYFSAPLTARGSIQYSPNDNICYALGSSFDRVTGATVSVGAEYTLYKIVALRAGYNIGEGSLRGLNLGAGFKIRNWEFDYSFNPHPELGSANRVSLTIGFGGNEKAQAKKVPPVAKAPIKFSLGEYKYSQDLVGATLLFGPSQVIPKNNESGKKFLRYVYSIKLCDDLPVIYANASSEGRPEENRRLTDMRMAVGNKYFKDAVAGLNKRDFDLTGETFGSAVSENSERGFIDDWKAKHGGVGPSRKDLEAFRVQCRNVSIKICFNLERWAVLREDKAVVKSLEAMRPGLTAQIESMYQAALKKTRS